MKKNLKTYNDDRYEIFCENNRYIVKDKNAGKYYRLNEDEFRVLDIDLVTRSEGISSFNFYTFLVVLFVLEVLNIYISLFRLDSDLPNIGEVEFIYLLIFYLPIFIVVHEYGHIFFFRAFGRKIDKIGFKFNYIFPSFFVRMNDTYLLTKKEKIIVHSGGVLFSLLINSFLFLIGKFFENILFIYLAKYMAVDIIVNSIPMMNSDGYKVVLAIKGIEETKYFTENSKLVKMVKLINLLFVLIYTIWFIYSL